MINVYRQIAANKRNSTIIISLFVGFICFAGYAVSYASESQGILPLAIIFSLFTSFGSFYFGDKIVLGLNSARPVSRKEFFDFYTVTENLAMADKLPVPKIYVIDSPALNAFATGRDPEHAIICATTGLLEKLDRTELEGVIGHELSHIKNFDTRLMTIVSILIGSLTILINMSSRGIFYRNRDDENKSNGILVAIGFILIIFAPIIAQLIQLAISRQREYFADAGSVMVNRQPGGLINALKKIDSDQNRLKTASTATASLYINNPFKGNKIATLFSTHPPIADRIKALESML